MSYKSEFPDYDGEFRVPIGFIDNSWHNDTMPRATKRVETIDDITIEINIWQDYVDMSKREYDNGKRYFFQIEVNGGCLFEYSTNKWSKIEKLVNALQ